ncbi:complexin-1-like [Cottoperca gobio]|uniref:Complexin-1-like n=1 Tax=Cottoperca gobio TaxID=56716 RepID=A0A6J2R9H6_COTGO|nr:complexin-1-like [Cottoperca gobio]
MGPSCTLMNTMSVQETVFGAVTRIHASGCFFVVPEAVDQHQLEEKERKGKYSKMEAERESMRQGIRDKYGLKKREEAEAEAAAAEEEPAEGSLTRPKKLVRAGCGDEEEEESIMDTVMKYLPGSPQDMLKK